MVTPEARLLRLLSQISRRRRGIAAVVRRAAHRPKVPTTTPGARDLSFNTGHRTPSLLHAPPPVDEVLGPNHVSEQVTRSVSLHAAA